MMQRLPQDSVFCRGQGILTSTPLLFQGLDTPAGTLPGPGCLVEHLPIRHLCTGSGNLMMLKLHHCLWQSRLKSFCFVGYTVLKISRNMVASPCLTRFKIGFLNKLLFCFLIPATIPLVKSGGTLVINHHSGRQDLLVSQFIRPCSFVT